MSIPEMQWAQVAEKIGGPLVYKQIPVPKPGPDQILVKIRYSGVCHTDLHAMMGHWPIPVKMPLVGGHEGAGIVVAKGSLVTGFEIGDASTATIHFTAVIDPASEQGQRWVPILKVLSELDGVYMKLLLERRSCYKVYALYDYRARRDNSYI